MKIRENVANIWQIIVDLQEDILILHVICETNNGTELNESQLFRKYGIIVNVENRKIKIFINIPFKKGELKRNELKIIYILD